MLPCAKRDNPVKEEIYRVLLWYEHGRSLAEYSASSCNKVGVNVPDEPEQGALTKALAEKADDGKRVRRVKLQGARQLGTSILQWHCSCQKWEQSKGRMPYDFEMECKTMAVSKKPNLEIGNSFRHSSSTDVGRCSSGFPLNMHSMHESSLFEHMDVMLTIVILTVIVLLSATFFVVYTYTYFCFIYMFSLVAFVFDAGMTNNSRTEATRIEF
nr:MLO-like protein 10 [Tanacetum cinerariifolium]